MLLVPTAVTVVMVTAAMWLMSSSFWTWSWFDTLLRALRTSWTQCVLRAELDMSSALPTAPLFGRADCKRNFTKRSQPNNHKFGLFVVWLLSPPIIDSGTVEPVQGAWHELQHGASGPHRQGGPPACTMAWLVAPIRTRDRTRDHSSA